MALPNNPTPAELVKAVKELEQGGGGTSTDVQVDSVSQVSGGVANLKTKNGNYNPSTNKLVTESDLPTNVAKTNADNTFTGINNFTNALQLNGTALTDLLYPVGSIYISTVNTSPATFIGGSWTKLPAGYALWTASSGAYNGSTGTISASLPNIKGTYTQLRADSGAGFDCDGVLFKNSISTSSGTGTGAGGKKGTITFNANAYNSIYKDSATTVQPPAIKVYAWRRISSSPIGTYKSSDNAFNITYSTNSLTVTSFNVGHYSLGYASAWTQSSSSPLTYTSYNNDQVYYNEAYKLVFNKTSGNWEAYLSEDEGSTYTLVGILTLQP